MKKIMCTLLFLLILPAMGFASEEPPPMPLRSMCQLITGHAQEGRWCEAWTKALEDFEKIRPAAPDETMNLLVLAQMEYCDQTQTIGIATTLIFESVYFAGQQPFLAVNLKVLNTHSYSQEAKELLEELWGVFEMAAEGLRDSVMMLNKGGKHEYKSVQLDTYDPFDRDWWHNREQQCGSAGSMFGMSRDR